MQQTGGNDNRKTLWQDMVEPDFLDDLRALVAQHIEPNAASIDARDVYPVEEIRALARAGYNSIFLPPAYGGRGSYLHALAVFEEASYASAAVGISLITILQAQTILHLFGNASLQQRYLPRFAQGLISAYALTEANHGSDIRSLDTKAKRVGDEWVLDGEKSFITSGSAAEFFIILAETEQGVSAFALPGDTRGLSTYVGENSATFGLRNGPHVNLVLDGCRLPLDHLIGIEGKGVRAAVTTLNYSRTMAAGISLGIARAAFDRSLAHARQRKVFDSTVFDKQGIQWYFADMVARIDAARLLTYRAAQALDTGGDVPRLSSEAKLVASALATEVASTSIQICGAYGVMENSPYGRYLRDAKAYEIAGGASEILRNTIGKALLEY
ncbi:acyl-CoA dehydrogenase family protein [Cupriavidus cauae]|uniref:acyl-CoA dehydrogenase family protein n=1 Tax=Cupriavidus TaxID=106589 RepID=UPI001CF56476|nr:MULTISPECIES: acyl-CoA dehydrogenase family protein [Cupriavidus]MCA7082938.1 acyl-CoA dehydrogenase family protein [Cupriavidus sp. DB3]UZN51086.1 acyl-CoA dehydrogenase family protein [Cupriavidus cauae]